MTRQTRTAIIGVATTLAVLLAGGLALLYSGAYKVAATEEHTAIASWLLNTGQNRSVAVRADEVPDPPQTDSAMLAQGFHHFRSWPRAWRRRRGRVRCRAGERRGVEPVQPAVDPGVSALIRPIPAGAELLRFEIPAMLLFAVALVPLAWNCRVLGRASGAVLLTGYVAFTVVLIGRALP